MERRDEFRIEEGGLFHGSNGRRSQHEFDDFDYGRRGGSFQSFRDEALWKHRPRAEHYNNDHFGYGHQDRGWTQNLDNQNRYRDSHFGKGSHNYRRSDDKILHEAFEVLTSSPTVDAHDIEVNVEDGILTLSGKVISRKMKREAESLVERIPGVEDVLNLLRPVGEPLVR